MRQHNPQGMPHPARPPHQDFPTGGYPQDTYRPYPSPSQYPPSDLHGFQEPTSTKKPGEERRQPPTHQVPNSQGPYAPNYIPAAPPPATRAASPIRAPSYIQDTPYGPPGVGGVVRQNYWDDPYAPPYVEPDWRWQCFREFLVSEPFEGRKAIQYELFDWHMEISERLSKADVAGEFLHMLQLSKQQFRSDGGCVVNGYVRHPSRTRQRDVYNSDPNRPLTPSRRVDDYWAAHRDPSYARRPDLEPSHRRNEPRADYYSAGYVRSESRPRDPYVRSDSRPRDPYGRSDSRPRDPYGRSDSRPRDSYGRSDSRPRDPYGRTDSRPRSGYPPESYVRPESRPRDSSRTRDAYNRIDPRTDLAPLRSDKRNDIPSNAGRPMSPDRAEPPSDVHARVPSLLNLKDSNQPDPKSMGSPAKEAESRPTAKDDTATRHSRSTTPTRAKLAKEITLTSDGVKKVHHLLELCEGDIKIFTFEDYPEESWRQHWLHLVTQFLCDTPPEIPGFLRVRPVERIIFATLLHNLNPNLQTLLPSHSRSADIKRFVCENLGILAGAVDHTRDDIIFVAATKINKVAGETQVMEFEPPVDTLFCVPLTGIGASEESAVIDFKHPTIKLQWDLVRTWIVSYKTASKPVILVSHGALKDAILIIVGLRRRAPSA